MADFISAIGQVVTALAAIGAVLVGIAGLHTWRRELRGRSDFSLAKDVLRAVYRVRDEIGHVRDSSMFPSEWYDRPDRDPKTPISNPKDVEYAYQKRWDRLVEVSSDLEAKLVEAEVLWGSLLAEPALDLKRRIARLNVNLRRHLRSLTNERYAEGLSPERLQEIDLVIWRDYEDPDVFGGEILEVVERFQSALRPHLGQSAKLSERLNVSNLLVYFGATFAGVFLAAALALSIESRRQDARVGQLLTLMKEECEGHQARVDNISQRIAAEGGIQQSSFERLMPPGMLYNAVGRSSVLSANVHPETLATTMALLPYVELSLGEYHEAIGIPQGLVGASSIHTGEADLERAASALSAYQTSLGNLCMAVEYELRLGAGRMTEESFAESMERLRRTMTSGEPQPDGRED